MSANTVERDNSVIVNRCNCLCSCAKKDRMCALTVLGAFEVIVALSSIGIGNWAIFAYPGHLRKTAAYNFWSGGVVCNFVFSFLKGAKSLGEVSVIMGNGI